MVKLLFIVDNIDDFKEYIGWLDAEGVKYAVFDKTIEILLDRNSVASMLVAITRSDLIQGYDDWLTNL